MVYKHKPVKRCARVKPVKEDVTSMGSGAVTETEFCGH